LTAGSDRCIKLCALTTWKERPTLSDHGGWVKSIAFSPDGGRLAYSGSDATIGLWDLERQRPHPAGHLSSHATGTKVGT
jgi:WD40 repeat protein